MAAMLDMAFQLLAFFILTFRPAPVEGQVMLRLPPPQPVTKMDAGQQAGNDATNKNAVQGLTTLAISALSQSDGRLGHLAIGETPVGSAAALDERMRAIFADPGAGFDQVVVHVGSRLHYEELMQIVDVCTRQKLASGEKLTKVSFIEVTENGG